MKNPTLDTTGSNRATTRDREHILNRHQERLVKITVRLWDVVITGLHQLDDGLSSSIIVSASTLLQGDQSATADDRSVITGEVILVQQLPDLHLDQLLELFVVDLVALVHENNDVRNTNLTRQQDVLAGLGHRAVSSGNHQNSAVHLSGTGDHVLHVVGVSRAVHMSVVTAVALVLHVGRSNGNAAGLLLRSLVDLVKRSEVCETSQRLDPRNRSGQRRLAMVNVTNGADVYVRLVANKLLFGHDFLRPFSRDCVELKRRTSSDKTAPNCADWERTLPVAGPATTNYLSECYEAFGPRFTPWSRGNPLAARSLRR